MHTDALTHLYLYEASQRARELQRRQPPVDPDTGRARRLPGRLRLRLRLRRPWHRLPA